LSWEAKAEKQLCGIMAGHLTMGKKSNFGHEKRTKTEEKTWLLKRRIPHAPSH